MFGNPNSALKLFSKQFQSRQLVKLTAATVSMTFIVAAVDSAAAVAVGEGGCGWIVYLDIFISDVSITVVADISNKIIKYLNIHPLIIELQLRYWLGMRLKVSMPIPSI